jgi:hypothetical protein
MDKYKKFDFTLTVVFAFLVFLAALDASSSFFQLFRHTVSYPPELMIEGKGTPGILYFDVSSFQLDGYLMTYNTATGELSSERLETFGMMHRPQSDGTRTAYTFTREQWQAVRSFADDVIQFADGGQIEIYRGDSVEIVQHPDGIDFHDFDILPDGNYLFMVSERRDMYRDSTQTCLPRCQVLGQAIVVVSPEGKELSRISLLDYYDRDDLLMDDLLMSGHTMLYDVTHANSVEQFPNGDYLVSVRHTSQVLRITQDGKLIWRFGANGDFEFINDDGISHQHSAIPLGNERIILFDNGNGKEPEASRGVEFLLDYEQMTATKVWEYSQGFSPNRGSVQRLTNGNTLIAFTEQSPDIVEVDPEGNIVFSLDMPDTNHYASYQAVLDETP